MGIMQIIKEYTEQIVEGDFDAAKVVCEKCNEKPGGYKLHECRKRQVRFSVGTVVEIVMTFVLRWKCSLCGATFTQYPPFIAPYKRFVLPEIVRLCRKYFEDGRFRFLCPVCGEFFTSTKADTYLAGCFRCERKFNTIDLTMVCRRVGFVEAAESLKAFLCNAGRGGGSSEGLSGRSTRQTKGETMEFSQAVED